MKVSFSEVDEAYIRNKVESGYYVNVTEVIRDAVRRLRESEQGRLEQALQEAEQNIADGNTEPLTRNLFQETVKAGIEESKQGKKITRPDVIPFWKHDCYH